MIVVDTSIWVSHLRNGNSKLKQLLSDGEILLLLENLPAVILKTEK